MRRASCVSSSDDSDSECTVPVVTATQQQRDPSPPDAARGASSQKTTYELTPEECELLNKAKRRRKTAIVSPDRAVQPTIKACFAPPSVWPEHTNVSVVDLFCCIGGFSTGCAASGHRLVLGVDNDQPALDAHAANHPSCRHELMELGPATEARLLEIMREDLPKTDDGTKFLPWHLHGSPPCQKLSALQRTRFPNSTTAERQDAFQEGMRMVLWYFDFAQTCFNTMNLTSWSFEEAPNPQLLERMRVLQRSRAAWFDFDIVEFWNFGVPQTRKRTIGGSPWLIDRVRHDGRLRETRVIQDVLVPPENAVSLGSVWKADRDKSLDVLDDDTGETINPNSERRTRRLHEVSFTIMAAFSNMWWHDSHMNRLRTLSIEERKRLQTFPPDYNLPSSTTDQIKGIGNAIPPLFAQKFMSRYRPV